MYLRDESGDTIHIAGNLYEAADLLISGGITFS